MKRHKGRRHSCPQLRTIEDVESMIGEAYIMVNAVKYGDDDWVRAEDKTRFPVKFSSRPQIQFVAGTPTVILTGFFREMEIQAQINRVVRLERTGLERYPMNSFDF